MCSNYPDPDKDFMGDGPINHSVPCSEDMWCVMEQILNPMMTCWLLCRMSTTRPTTTPPSCCNSEWQMCCSMWVQLSFLFWLPEAGILHKRSVWGLYLTSADCSTWVQLSFLFWWPDAGVLLDVWSFPLFSPAELFCWMRRWCFLNKADAFFYQNS